MSEKENTPEPIGYGEDNDGWYLSQGNEQIAHGLTEEHARRIVACVNACAGFPVDLLERGRVVQVTATSWNEEGINIESRSVNHEAEAITKQRDELLAALEPLRGKFRSGNCIPVERSVITAKEWSRVESAIAAVEQPGAKPSTDADGWIEWNGGECPVSGNTIVQIKMRDGVKDRDLAKSYSWSNFGIDGDIIAYRIVREGGAV